MNTQNKPEFNPIIKTLFIIGAFVSLVLNTNTGKIASKICGDIALYIYPLVAIIYAGCLFSILSLKKIIFVWITFFWIFAKDLLIYLVLFNHNDNIAFNFEKQIISNIMLVIGISCILLIKNNGKSGWQIIMTRNK